MDFDRIDIFGDRRRESDPKLLPIEEHDNVFRCQFFVRVHLYSHLTFKLKNPKQTHAYARLITKQ